MGRRKKTLEMSGHGDWRYFSTVFYPCPWGWSGGAKVSCILRYRGVQLILAYSWAWPAVLLAGKGKGGMFLFLLFFTFVPAPFPSLSLSFISSTISFLPFSGRRHKMTHKGWRVVKPQHNQISMSVFYLDVAELPLPRPYFVVTNSVAFCCIRWVLVPLAFNA